mmetsp:Transcript_20519/g.50351  ORF Transcript_20519/g.50351 Transcript_20519/m.50351 type:complete len:247 (+) Transcript_20519:4066-4806(+)
MLTRQMEALKGLIPEPVVKNLSLQEGMQEISKIMFDSVETPGRLREVLEDPDERRKQRKAKSQAKMQDPNYLDVYRIDAEMDQTRSRWKREMEQESVQEEQSTRVLNSGINDSFQLNKSRSNCSVEAEHVSDPNELRLRLERWELWKREHDRKRTVLGAKSTNVSSSHVSKGSLETKSSDSGETDMLMLHHERVGEIFLRQSLRRRYKESQRNKTDIEIQTKGVKDFIAAIESEEKSEINDPNNLR